jgi:[histone H3]-lysine79 N-trimethyltransferase
MLQQQQQSQYLQNQRERESAMMFQQRQVEEKREFKTPDNVRYEQRLELGGGRSSVGSIENEYINSGTSKSQTQRSSSSLSQPDYTQVSPAKLALRRHLSQEKLSQHPSMGPGQLMTKTIGEFINQEIEKTLEITPQSIINAVIQHNMPTGARLSNESVINFSMNQQERETDSYATLKPTSSKSQHHQQNFMQQEHFVDHRQRMKPTTSAAARKSAISSPPMRQDEPMSFISGPKSPHERHYHHQQQQHHQESSYKIDTKMFTSNIGKSMRKDDGKEKIMEQHEPPLEGLAASLRQHVIASMQIKQETETEPKYPSYQRNMPTMHHQQRPSGMMYGGDMSDDHMMYSGGPSGSNERNLTPLSRHRADEGL